MTPDTYLLIGLGNPGREYRDNRHNVGFMLIDRLIIRLNARGMKVQSKAIVTTATYPLARSAFAPEAAPVDRGAWLRRSNSLAPRTSRACASGSVVRPAGW